MMQKIEQAAQQQRRRALVADDDPIMRSLLRSRLALLVDEVVEASEGLEAWHRLSGERFDLAIVDLMMPGLDGFGLIGCLRGHPRTRHMPIVVVTSMNDRESIERALEAGASSFLTKPLAWSTFNAHVGHLMRLSTAAEAAELRQSLAAAEAEAARETARDLAATISGWLDGLGRQLDGAGRTACDLGALAREAADGAGRLRRLFERTAERTVGGPYQRLEAVMAAAAWDARVSGRAPVPVRLEGDGSLAVAGPAARRAIAAWLACLIGRADGDRPVMVTAARIGGTIELRAAQAEERAAAAAASRALPDALDRLAARLAARAAGASLDEAPSGIWRLALPAAAVEAPAIGPGTASAA